MASKRPSFLKRQKEQKRLQRAIDKRLERDARRQGRADEPSHPETTEATEERPS